MMKIFTASDYEEIDEASRQKVDNWIKEHEVDAAYMIISNSTRHENPLDKNEFIEKANIYIYNVPITKTYILDKTDFNTAYFEDIPDVLVKTHMFDKDDFPWEVLGY